MNKLVKHKNYATSFSDDKPATLYEKVAYNNIVKFYIDKSGHRNNLTDRQTSLRKKSLPPQHICSSDIRKGTFKLFGYPIPQRLLDITLTLN